MEVEPMRERETGQHKEKVDIENLGGMIYNVLYCMGNGIRKKEGVWT